MHIALKHLILASLSLGSFSDVYDTAHRTIACVQGTNGFISSKLVHLRRLIRDSCNAGKTCKSFVTKRLKTLSIYFTLVHHTLCRPRHKPSGVVLDGVAPLPKRHTEICQIPSTTMEQKETRLLP